MHGSVTGAGGVLGLGVVLDFFNPEIVLLVRG